jgi:hypothetical protein
VKHDFDFSKLIGLLDVAVYAAQHLAEWVMLYPQQVTAGCLLYLCFGKLISSFRRSGK